MIFHFNCIMDTDFSEYYKKISNVELLDILDNEQDYNPLAIAAANLELEQRELSPIDIEEARYPRNAEKLLKEMKAEKKMALQEKMNTAGESIFSAVKPGDTNEVLTNKIIVWVVIIYGLEFLISIPTIFSMFRGEFGNGSPSTFLLFLLPQLLIPVALYIFWKRKSAGWTLLTICITYSLVADLAYVCVKIASMYTYRSFSWWHITATDIFELFIQASLLFVICRKDIRLIYDVNVSKMAGIIFISALLTFLIGWSFLH